MCLIALALGASERFPFVIAANRDEYLDRPTQALSLWHTASGTPVLSGRDLRDGGIWMGFGANGRFAMLTNVRQPHAQPPQQPISRGGLALAWLDSRLQATDFARTLDPLRYQGFNLIVGDALAQQCHHLSNQAFYSSNQPLAQRKQALAATEFIANHMPWGAIYGLSNAQLDTPWPKTVQLKTALATSLKAADAASLVALNLRALENDDVAPDEDLPQTGVPSELERSLSSIWVSHPRSQPVYGTRSSLVAVQTASGKLDVSERSFSHADRSFLSQQAQMNWF
jgi:uncharacterized protein with NRDE domain